MPERLPPPLPALPDDPRCVVGDPAEALRILGELVRRQAPVTVHGDGHEGPVPSLLLAASAAGIELDGSTVEVVNQRLARSTRLVCQSELDRIPVYFRLGPPVLHQAGGRTSLRAGFPSPLLYLQRRELYRLQTPVQQSPVFRFTSGEPPTEYSVRIADISAGGIGLNHQLEPELLSPSQELEACRIELPDATLHPITVRVANDRPTPHPDGRPLRRTGLMFVGLRQATQNLISRYIFTVERQRNARRRGHD